MYNIKYVGGNRMKNVGRNRQYDTMAGRPDMGGSANGDRKYGPVPSILADGRKNEVIVKPESVSETLIRQTKEMAEYALNTLDRLRAKVEPISRCSPEQEPCTDNVKRTNTYPKLYEEWYMGNIAIGNILDEINVTIDRIEL